MAADQMLWVGVVEHQMYWVLVVVDQTWGVVHAAGRRWDCGIVGEGGCSGCGIGVEVYQYFLVMWVVGYRVGVLR